MAKEEEEVYFYNNCVMENASVIQNKYDSYASVNGNLNVLFDEETHYDCYFAFYENQRRLFPNGTFGPPAYVDSFAFSTDEASSEGAMTRQQMIQLIHSKNSNINIPHCWQIEVSPYTDAHGWYYATGGFWRLHSLKTRTKKPYLYSMVRRRRWIAIPTRQSNNTLFYQSDDELQQTYLNNNHNTSGDDYNRVMKAVKHAGDQASTLLRQVKRPLYVTVLKTDNLVDNRREKDITLSSYVMITTHSTKDQTQEYCTRTHIVENSINPEWNQKILLPGIDMTSDICFTVFDHDYLLRDKVLGQGVLSTAELTQPLVGEDFEIGLSKDLQFRPIRPDSSKFTISSSSKNLFNSLQPYLNIRIDPLPLCTSMVGYILMNKKKFISDQDDYYRYWLCLVDDELFFYDVTNDDLNRIACKPTGSIKMDEVDAIWTHENYFLIVTNDRIRWKFVQDDRLLPENEELLKEKEEMQVMNRFDKDEYRQKEHVYLKMMEKKEILDRQKEALKEEWLRKICQSKKSKQNLEESASV